MQLAREVFVELWHCLRSVLICVAVLVVLAPLLPGTVRFTANGFLVYAAFVACLAAVGFLWYRRRVFNRRETQQTNRIMY